MKKLYIILSVMFMALTATAQHEYVDLGLPSGTLWATCNIGADSPEEIGDFFAWGETAPKSLYNSSTYSCEGYDDYEGSPKELLPEDDAATVNWGSEWQMPNQKQYKELVNEMYTTMEWTTMNGVDGCKITSKSNGNSIFLPVTGYYSGTSFQNSEGSMFWSRTASASQLSICFLLYTNRTTYSNYSRTLGLNIRPVRVLEEKEHEYVDLGLPSGTMWATCNVGAYSPEGYGDYFRWGETEPQETIYGKYSFTDNPIELLPENDAAAVNWGSDWRTPSLAQIEELTNERYTTTEWTTLNGVNGRKITSKSNGNSIFLPAAGDIYTSGYYGWYWLRSIDTSDNNKAYSLLLNSDGINAVTNARKRYFPVRPVCFAKEVYTEFEDSTGTLTYYYDGQRPYRTGITEAYDPIGGNSTTRFNDYNEKVTKAVIHPSMKKAPLTSMRLMFFGSLSLSADGGVLHITSYPLSNMTSIEGLENLNTENVTDMYFMFHGCSSLTSVNLSSFNTENVTNMAAMFSGCSSLTSVDLNSFNNTNVADLDNMFTDCHELTTICCTKDWSTSEATSDGMFSGCEKLVGGKGTPWNSSVTDKAYARPDRGENAPGYFTAMSIKGDVNGDGDVNSGDVVAVYSYIIKGTESGFDFDSANVNDDSGVNSADVVAIYNIIIGN